MQTRLLTAVFLSGLVFQAASAQTAAPAAASTGSMDGMKMDSGSSDQSPAAAAEKAQSGDMDKGKMSGTGMDKMNGMSMEHCRMMDHALTKPPAGTLRIAYAGKSADWTPTTLAALPHKAVTVYNEHTKTNQNFSGVPLIDLLKPLGVPAKPSGRQLRLYLVAAGTDGYEALFSLAEVAPEYHESNLIVADTLEGKPLSDKVFLQLIGTGDKGLSRSVQMLTMIQVLAAE